MDFTNKRLNLKHKTREYLIESDILDVNFEIDNDIFYVIIKTNNIDQETLKHWEFYHKIIKRINEFAYKLNKNYKIKIIKKTII